MAEHMRYHPHSYLPHKHEVELTRPFYGTSDSSDQGFDDVAELELDVYSSLGALTVFYDKAGILGISAEYKTGEGKKMLSRVHPDVVANCRSASINLALGEDLAKVRGHADTHVTRLEVETTKGQKIDVGGPTAEYFEFDIPQGYVVNGFAGDYNAEHLLKLSVTVRPQYVWHPEAVTINTTGANADGVEFDDYDNLVRGAFSSRIKSVGIIYSPEKILGIELIYNCNGGHDQRTKVHKEASAEEEFHGEFVLNPDENVYGIHGTEEDGIITSLSFISTTGRTRDFGFKKGSEFEYDLPTGKKVIALGGKVSDQGVHQLTALVTHPYPLP